MEKRGALNLSFGMIFSIFLIIIFIAFAVYAITKFLDLQNQMEVGKFIDSFQTDIDRMWKSVQGSQEVEYNLDKKIEEVCFDEDSRLFFKPLGTGGDFDYREIEHINVEGAFCIKVIDGKISMTIKKDFNEVLVKIVK